MITLLFNSKNVGFCSFLIEGLVNGVELNHEIWYRKKIIIILIYAEEDDVHFKT